LGADGEVGGWERIIPSDEEKKRVTGYVKGLVAEVESFVSDAGLEADVVPVGSTAKDTFLSGASDVDVFVVSDDYKKLFELVKLWKPEGKVKRGELLIWNYREDGFEIDLVFVPPDHPKIETLRHTEYYKRNLTSRMRDEVRKAKAFFKSRGVYKAELGGITGVAIEELIRRYGTFDGVCRFFVEYNYGEVHLQDPTASRPRNLLASINKTRWKQIQDSCKRYLVTKKPELKPFTKADFIERHREAVIIKCDRRFDVATDFNTSLSLCHKAGNETRNYEPEISFFCDSYVDDEVLIAAKVEPPTLPEQKEVCIPKKLTGAIEAFAEAHPEVELYQKGEYLCGVVERTISEPQRYMTEKLIERMRDRGYSCEVVKDIFG